MTEIKKIYFDMDGVLADFERGVREISGADAPEQSAEARRSGADDAMWENIKKDPHFYDHLEFMPGAKEMFDAVRSRYGDRVEILTGIPKPKRGIVSAADDKTGWVHRLLSADIKVNIVFREEKPQYCSGPECILIDDMESNIRDWEAFGGTGIVNVCAEKTVERLKELGVL